MRSAMMRSTTPESRPFEQRDAFAQRRLEGDLAIHRAGGDGGDAVLQARPRRPVRRCIPGRSWSNPCRRSECACGAWRPRWTTMSSGASPTTSRSRDCARACVEAVGQRTGRARRRAPASAWRVAPSAADALVARAVFDRPSGRVRNQRGDERHGQIRSDRQRGAPEERGPDSRADGQRQVGRWRSTSPRRMAAPSSTPTRCRAMPCSTC